MEDLSFLLDQNKAWAANITARDPEFFLKLSRQQKPDYMWIGCSDSRVPANELINVLPGEVFVHRNVANVVVHSDLNCLSAMQFAVDVLKVKHIIVCGHSGCGGVRAALKCERHGLVDNWIRHVQDVKDRHYCCIQAIPEESRKLDRLCELNVIEQVANVCQTTVVTSAWDRGQSLTVHGWIYGLKDGHLRDLQVTASGHESFEAAYRSSRSKLGSPVVD
ncbi:carbonate dehydratase [Nibricoccus aquaticus]|uniref:Carbonic anhydrase n=1 Tax=Nibricoccus aquaticus TaxID=2576891 RepID=A0A290Q5Z6_9BACT|nr:carbonate dehydratase [Nibricoccus aquaticus]ATC63863.1 carbonate dehydratase [Nibricoccus aquaticus]